MAGKHLKAVVGLLKALFRSFLVFKRGERCAYNICDFDFHSRQLIPPRVKPSGAVCEDEVIAFFASKSNTANEMSLEDGEL